MLQLNQNHLDAFNSTAAETFETRAALHLRRSLPDSTNQYSDDQLRERARSCIVRAGRYGLTTEQQVMCFVDATFLAGESFDTDPQRPWAPAALLNETSSADDKATAILVYAHIDVRKGAPDGEEDDTDQD